MKKYSPVLMDFNNMTLSFQIGEHEIVLKGGLHPNAMKIISGNKMQKIILKNPEVVGEIYMLNAEVVVNEIPPTLQAVIAEYKDVFEEPTGMPPKRKHDHSITLKPGIETVNARPYRMPYYQKIEVENQVAEMQLNALTVKKKFPILVVDDLLDELAGANFFSKLDLRSGYWHIRIKLEDIPKTAFRTHHEIEYLGHIISHKGVSTDSSKIQAIQDWTIPKNLKSLRGFLGLTGYYKKFIKGYGEINFTKLFCLETDASSKGIGKHNRAADALSRQFEDSSELNQLSATIIIPAWVQEVENSYEQDSLAKDLIPKLLLKNHAIADWSYTKGVLRYKVHSTLHDSPQGGHSEIQATYHRMKLYFYWKGMKAVVKQHVQQCDQAWEFITMDFIEGLPTSNRYNSILVVIDKFTKYGHFLPLVHPFTATEVAKIFLDQVYKLHGQPKIALSDRDKNFTSVFWKEFLKLLGTTTLFTTAYHPQTDGQTERLNHCLEQYIRGLCFLKPSSWAKWLSHAEWWYNTSFHTTLGTTPLHALYGYTPPTMTWITESRVADVQQFV
ncbi:uncharacterized protein K02A2.6-like [Hibiscus syriacus]|uniref:uncharacterized protein K02A2.6-like n=1 Tax=Hibiscus syriacus TaxID=106335 RepID=UPI001924D546|nr:uncharacterized protein K02A2.6-like [Hibiscus syriacus]